MCLLILVYINLSNVESLLMNVERKKESILSGLAKQLTLKLLWLMGLISPNCATWFKRMFFVLSVYTELKRHRLYERLTIDKVNERILKVKNQKVLKSAIGISENNLAQLNIVGAHQHVDIFAILRKQDISIPEAEMVSRIIVDQTPDSLRYNPKAMSRDIVKLLTD